MGKAGKRRHAASECGGGGGGAAPAAAEESGALPLAAHSFADWTPPVHTVVAMDYCDALRMAAVARRSHEDRELHTLELWSGAGLPCLHHVLSATHAHSSLECVQLLSSGRLFAATAAGIVCEYDAALAHRRHVHVSPSAVWAMAKSPDEHTLACGLDNGHVALLDTSGGTPAVRRMVSLSFDRRAVSLAWHPGGRHLAVGSVDAIQVVGLDENLAPVRRLRIDMDRKGRLDHVVVWTLLFLKNYTVVSGDSRGRTSFWHALHGTFIATHTLHEADVFAVCLQEAGRVLAAGIDPKVVVYAASVFAQRDGDDDGATGGGQTLTQANALSVAARAARKRPADGAGGADPSAVRWRPAGLKRVHTHDVRCMCRAAGSGGISYVLSAGADGFVAVNGFRPTPTALMHAPFGHRHVSSSADGSRVLLRNERSLQLWHIAQLDGVSAEDAAAAVDGGALPPACVRRPRRLLARIETRRPIEHGTLSADGRVVLAADCDRSELYHVAGDGLDAVDVSVARYKTADGAPLPPVTAAVLHRRVGWLFTADRRMVQLRLDDISCVCDAETVCEDYALMHTDLLHSVVVSAHCDQSGSALALISSTGHVYLCTVAGGDADLTMSALHKPDGGSLAVSLCWMGAGRRLAVLYSDFTLRTYDCGGATASPPRTVDNLHGYAASGAARRLGDKRTPPMPLACVTADPGGRRLCVFGTRTMLVLTAKAEVERGADADECAAPSLLSAPAQCTERLEHLCYARVLDAGQLLAVHVHNDHWLRALPPAFKTRMYGVR